LLLRVFFVFASAAVRLLECWLHLELLHPGLPPFCSSGISWLESRPLSQLELLHPQLPPSCSPGFLAGVASAVAAGAAAASAAAAFLLFFFDLVVVLSVWVAVASSVASAFSSSWPMLEWLPDSAPSQARLST